MALIVLPLIMTGGFLTGLLCALATLNKPHEQKVNPPAIELVLFKNCQRVNIPESLCFFKNRYIF